MLKDRRPKIRNQSKRREVKDELWPGLDSEGACKKAVRGGGEGFLKRKIGRTKRSHKLKLAKLNKDTEYHSPLEN